MNETSEEIKIDKEDGKEKENGVEKTRVNLDTILEEEIGQFGRYQIKMVMFVLCYTIFVAWAAVEYIFTTARINTRCLISECDPVYEAPQFAPSWLTNAVPTSGSTIDGCSRFANISQSSNQTDDFCPATLFDRDNIMPCDGYVYENTHSVVYDYELACDEWRRTFIGSARTFGSLLALPITGFISDRWGRKVALLFNALNTAWIGITRYFADTYIGFLISEFVESLVGSGGYSCAYILLMELVGPKYRVIVGAALNSSFTIGQITMGLIAWRARYWRKLTLILYLPQIIVISLYWLMSESVRWYMSKDRYNKSEEILKEIARVNGKVLSDSSLKTLKQSMKDESNRNKESVPDPWLIVQVFRHKKVLIRCLVAPVWWITMTLIYYGLSINAVNMSGNRYVNYIVVSAVEIPGFWAAVLLMNRIGRKPVLIAAYWICAACQIAYIFLPIDMYGASLTVYLISKCSIACVAMSIYVYTAELYPTKHRHTLFAFSSMVGRIGSIVAPLTPALGAAVWEQLPFALFAGFAFVSGVLMFLTPETRGTTLPDTMDEAERLGTTK